MQFTIDEKTVELDRIYNCVNAMQGIDDPEAFMRNVQNAADELEGYINEEYPLEQRVKYPELIGRRHANNMETVDALRKHLKGGAE